MGQPSSSFHEKTDALKACSKKWPSRKKRTSHCMHVRDSRKTGRLA
ncbi:hypothetical protein B4100_2073 [Heyndrickxia coagulans]|nr:hypothetical protein B4100_2073 [Heyndrickxia coagulans]